MALQNTGNAFYKILHITKTVGDTTTTHDESIMAAIPGTNFGQLTEDKYLQNLSTEDAQARYNAFETYMAQKYPGLNVAAISPNQPIDDSERAIDLCPIGALPAEIFTVSVKASGDGTATVNGQTTVSVDRGTPVTLNAAPNNDYNFDGWYINGQQKSSDIPWTYTVNGNVTIEARFSTPPLDLNTISLAPYRNNGTWEISAQSSQPVASEVTITGKYIDDLGGSQHNFSVTITIGESQGWGGFSDNLDARVQSIVLDFAECNPYTDRRFYYEVEAVGE